MGEKCYNIMARCCFQPIDSLGFHLCWAAGEDGATVELTGVRAVGQAAAPLRTEHDGAPVGGAYRPWPALLADPGYLAEIATETPAGAWRYGLVLDLQIHGTERARLEVAGLSARGADGKTFQLPSPAVNIGGGWTLTMPPGVQVPSSARNEVSVAWMPQAVAAKKSPRLSSSSGA